MKRLRVTLVCLLNLASLYLRHHYLRTLSSNHPFSLNPMDPGCDKDRDRDQHRADGNQDRGCLPCQVVSASFACPLFQATRFERRSLPATPAQFHNLLLTLIMSRTSALYFVNRMCTVLGEYKLHRFCNQLSSAQLSGRSTTTFRCKRAGHPYSTASQAIGFTGFACRTTS